MKTSSLIRVFAILALLTGFATGCTTIFDDLSDCPSGQYFRFVYDMTVSGGDAFGAQVGFASIFIYDEDGKYVNTFSGQGSDLDENGYRMHTDLPAGKYTIVSWCLSSPAMASFTSSDFSSFDEFTNTLDLNGGVSSQDLNPLWHWSTSELTVGNEGEEYTIHLTKDTNNIRVVLQHVDGSAVDPSLFDFTINGVSRVIYAADNHTEGEVTYKPYASGQSSVGGDSNGSSQISVAYAEFSTSRLIAGSKSRLVITIPDEDRTVLDIPLIDYLAMRSEKYASWSDQNYLDRESDYSLVLFLDEDNNWFSSRIVVNGWTIRVNNI